MTEDIRRSGEKGFTLTELMVAVTISTIMLTAMYFTMRSGNEHVQTTDLKMAIQDSAREGLHKMMQELRQSAPDRVNIGAGGNSVIFDVPDAVAPFDPITYEVDWAAAETVQYSINGTQLIRTDMGTGVVTVIANDVTDVDFVADNPANPSVVTVTLRVQRALLSGRNVPTTPLQVTGQAEVRND